MFSFAGVSRMSTSPSAGQTSVAGQVRMAVIVPCSFGTFASNSIFP
jgi:hypothetical protein